MFHTLKCQINGGSEKIPKLNKQEGSKYMVGLELEKML